MSGPTLTEFLLARIAAVEERVTGGAQGAQTSYYGWHTVDCGVVLGYRADEECVCRYVDRVLADCEAKRHIVEWAQTCEDKDVHVDAWCMSKVTLAHLATVYADHPDYRQEWKP